MNGVLRHEAARLEFLERRDGLDGAQDFARRTLVESCLDFRLYLRLNVEVRGEGR